MRRHNTEKTNRQSSSSYQRRYGGRLLTALVMGLMLCLAGAQPARAEGATIIINDPPPGTVDTAAPVLEYSGMEAMAQFSRVVTGSVNEEARVALFLDGGAPIEGSVRMNGSSGQWDFSLGLKGLTPGRHEFILVAIDTAGNESQAFGPISFLVASESSSSVPPYTRDDSQPMPPVTDTATETVPIAAQATTVRVDHQPSVATNETAPVTPAESAVLGAVSTPSLHRPENKLTKTAGVQARPYVSPIWALIMLPVFGLIVALDYGSRKYSH